MTEARNIDPHDPVALRVAARIFEKLRDARRASEVLVLLVESDPGNGALLAEAGGQLFSAGDFERAKPLSGQGRKPPAIMAAAHVLLTLMYKVLLTGIPYPERGALMTEQQRNRLIRRHVCRRAPSRASAGARTQAPAT